MGRCEEKGGGMRGGSLWRRVGGGGKKEREEVDGRGKKEGKRGREGKWRMTIWKGKG